MINRLTYCVRVIAVAPLMVMLHPHVGGAIEAAKRADIVVLMKEMGTFTNMDRMIDILVPTIIGNIQKVNPKVPQPVWDELVAAARDEMKKSANELEEPLITIYDANFTSEEIKQLAAFYSSPLGHKMATQMPQLLQQTIAMSQAWGERVGGRVEERIRTVAKQKGYNL